MAGRRLCHTAMVRATPWVPSPWRGLGSWITGRIRTTEGADGSGLEVVPHSGDRQRRSKWARDLQERRKSIKKLPKPSFPRLFGVFGPPGHAIIAMATDTD